MTAELSTEIWVLDWSAVLLLVQVVRKPRSKVRSRSDSDI